MDDIFIFAETEELCTKAVDDLKLYLSEVGAELNDKLRMPAQRGAPLLGLELDTIDIRSLFYQL
jgi:hypothetical protein